MQKTGLLVPGILQIAQLFLTKMGRLEEVLVRQPYLGDVFAFISSALGSLGQLVMQPINPAFSRCLKKPTNSMFNDYFPLAAHKRVPCFALQVRSKHTHAVYMI